MPNSTQQDIVGRTAEGLRVAGFVRFATALDLVLPRILG
jgi:hypothetical protein